jgi:hypothetical protein
MVKLHFFVSKLNNRRKVKGYGCLWIKFIAESGLKFLLLKVKLLPLPSEK